MLQWLHKSGECDLSKPTELGTTCAYLAVLNDRPEVLRLLAECGIDLTKPCDAMNYGAPAFWAAKYGREHCLLELFNLGVDIHDSCERFGKVRLEDIAEHKENILVDVISIFPTHLFDI